MIISLKINLLKERKLLYDVANLVAGIFLTNLRLKLASKNCFSIDKKLCIKICFNTDKIFKTNL